MVLNDEAHHCYREKPSDDADTLKGEEKKGGGKLKVAGTITKAQSKARVDFEKGRPPCRLAKLIPIGGGGIQPIVQQPIAQHLAASAAPSNERYADASCEKGGNLPMGEIPPLMTQVPHKPPKEPTKLGSLTDTQKFRMKQILVKQISKNQI